MTTPSIPLYREILLTQDQVAIVDAADYEWLNQWKWHASWRDVNQSYYAGRRILLPGEKTQRFLAMHRLILGLDFDDPRFGDHIEVGNTLDNRRSNLRIATRHDNARNRRKYKCNTTGFKGVGFHPTKAHPYSASIRVNGKLLHLGYRDTAAEASVLYCEAAKKQFGEFANLT